MEVTWLPFELHPEVPAAGLSRAEFFGAERSAQMEQHVQRMGEEVGLTMRTRDRLINTRLALAAAEFAREQGRFEAMHRELFEGHWHGTARLEDPDELARLGARAGLDPAALREALDGGRFEPELDRWRGEATGMGINAIPAHVIGGRYLVVGAQPYDVFREVLRQVEAAARAG